MAAVPIIFRNLGEGADWVEWPSPGRFTSGKGTGYPLYRSHCGPRDRSGQMWKILPSPARDPPKFRSYLKILGNRTVTYGSATMTA